MSGSAGSDADILVPEVRFVADKIAHHLDALFVVPDFDYGALGAHPLFGSEESGVFSGDDTGNLVKNGCARTHGAGGEGGVEGASAIDTGREAASIFNGIHFSVEDGAAALDSAIVPPSDDLTVVHEHGADGDASLTQAETGFFDGSS